MFLSHARPRERERKRGCAKKVSGRFLRLNYDCTVENGRLYYNQSWRPRVRAEVGRLEEILRHESNEERKGKEGRKEGRGTAGGWMDGWMDGGKEGRRREAGC